MEKARQHIKEQLDEENQISVEHDAEFYERLKSQTNNLCWTYLPNSMSLSDADAISSTIYEMLINPQYFLPKKAVQLKRKE